MLVYSTIKYASGVPTQPLNNATIPANTPIWVVWLKEGIFKLPLKFQPSGQSESVEPFEYKGSSQVTFPEGANFVEVYDATGKRLEGAVFTVGTVTPPPTTKEPVTVNVKADISKVDVKFQVNGQPV